MVNEKEDSFNIVLIGFMGTGKTTIAKELSDGLNIQFIDVDRLIEENTGMSIPEIFEKCGEQYFRQIEKETIERISRLENIVISSGGGTCLDPENISNIRKKGRVVLLEADPETIIKRTENDENRPLLRGKNSIESIKKIMDERKDSYYKAADIIIDTKEKSVGSIKDEILKALSLESKI